MNRPLQYPVILCHGLFGAHRYGAGPFHAGDYFRGILRALQETGVRAYAPRVHPTAGVYRRTWKLAQRIEHKFGDSPIHLVGHSMGGLDARNLANDPHWEERIISITTIGTPHLGTKLAELASSNLCYLYVGVEKMGLDIDGIHQVSSRYTRKLTADWKEPRWSTCWSVAGNPEPSNTFFGLRPSQSWLANHEGPNDGLVSMESALGWGDPLPPWPHDHFRQINWMTPRSATPGVYESYRQLVYRLMEVEAEWPRHESTQVPWSAIPAHSKSLT